MKTAQHKPPKRKTDSKILDNSDSRVGKSVEGGKILRKKYGKVIRRRRSELPRIK